MPIIAIAPASTAIRIPIGDGLWLDADVITPPRAKGVVLFAHGSGSSRHSPRNREVAADLNVLQFATVLADLLAEDENELGGALRFDIPLLTRRTIALIDWVRSYGLVGTLPLGLFGASTGAAAALDAAAARPEVVCAVVSRGGRPDLATRLDDVKAPTLLIVGGLDTDVLRLNEVAFARLHCPKGMRVIPGATHLFEEPGKLDAVAARAGSWFQEYLR